MENFIFVQCKIAWNTCCVNNVKARKPNTTSKSAKLKKGLRKVTVKVNVTPPTLVFSKRFIIKLQPSLTLSSTRVF